MIVISYHSPTLDYRPYNRISQTTSLTTTETPRYEHLDEIRYTRSDHGSFTPPAARVQLIEPKNS